MNREDRKERKIDRKIQRETKVEKGSKGRVKYLLKE